MSGTRLAVALDLISFEAHRFLSSDLPVVSVLLGGALFGAGMVLTGGCVSRLTVLVGTGNLRALLVLIVFAITAHAVMKGALAPVREALGSATLPGGEAVALSAWPGGEVWPLLVAGAALVCALLSRAKVSHLAMAGAIGLLVPLGWIGTGFVLLDDFDPIPMQSMGFTGPTADTLFWTVAATSIPAGFGTGLVAGVPSRQPGRGAGGGRVPMAEPGRAATDRALPRRRRDDGSRWACWRAAAPSAPVYPGSRRQALPPCLRWRPWRSLRERSACASPPGGRKRTPAQPS